MKYKNSPIVLMYHRIENSLSFFDPWRLTVTLENFDRQLKILAANREVFSLQEFMTAYKAGALPCNAVAVTFDDGYADNLLLAKPVLKKYGIPATAFLVTDTLGSRSFWWDRLVYILYTIAKFPEKIAFCDQEHMFIKDLLISGDENHALRHLWLFLRDISSEDRDKFLGRLEEKTGVTYPLEGPRPLTVCEAIEMADALIDIGSHTLSHYWLPEVSDPNILRQEIVGSRIRIKEIFGYAPPIFSYPYGACTDIVRDEVVQAGYLAAVTVVPSALQENTDSFLVPRLAVDDDMNNFVQLIGV
jgi:peptidoglycan/xylan/chitin deacetylase (PgdA/CDA1 family)